MPRSEALSLAASWSLAGVITLVSMLGCATGEASFRHALFSNGRAGFRITCPEGAKQCVAKAESLCGREYVIRSAPIVDRTEVECGFRPPDWTPSNPPPYSRPDATPPEPQPHESVPAERASAADLQIRVRNQCDRVPGKLLVHVRLPFRSEPKGSKATNGTMLRQFSCSTSTRHCQSVQLVLSRVERTHEIGVLDFDASDDEIISDQGSVVVIRSGLSKTFTVDLAQQRVTYVHSNHFGEERGSAACPVTVNNRE